MNRTSPNVATVMAEAVEHAITHVDRGGLPFVGVVVSDAAAGPEALSCFGTNEVWETGDPSAHAEIVAMRDVLARRGPGSLEGAHLLATGEPCGLCFRFAVDHGIAAVHVAVDRDRVARYGFDYRASYRHFGITDALRDTLLHPLPVSRDARPFTHYLNINNEGASS